MLPLEHAQERILDAISVLLAEDVPLRRLPGRVLARDLVAVRDAPPEDNSAMDGYALRWDDAREASERWVVGGEGEPITLQVARTIAAGGRPGPPLRRGEAAKIMTGAPTPEGTGLVVMREWTDDGEAVSGQVEIRQLGPKGHHIRAAAEDVRAGEPLLCAGLLLGPGDIGLIASQGMAEASCRRRPIVAILATGDEVQRPGAPIDPGHIYSSNSYALAAQVEECGAEVRDLGIARDTHESLRAALAGLDGADALLTIGGVSVGDFDHVKAVLAELGASQEFWKVATRPGKPNAFGQVAGVPYWALPGNPVSCMVSFYQYVRPALLKMQGLSDLFLPTAEAILSEPVRSREGFLFLVRGICSRDEQSGRYSVRGTGAQGSGILRSMSLANCLIIAPEHRGAIEAGEQVRIQLLPSVRPRQAAAGVRRVGDPGPDGVGTDPPPSA